MCESKREREKGASDDSVTITHHIAVQYSTFTMGKENNQNNDSNNSGDGDGDNNLMGLFAPPPPPPTIR